MVGPRVEWRAPDWRGRYAAADVAAVFEALTTAIEGLRISELIDDMELGQLRQVAMCASAQEAALLSAALAAQPDDLDGQREFLGILRTVANKPVPVGAAPEPTARAQLHAAK